MATNGMRANWTVQAVGFAVIALLTFGAGGIGAVVTYPNIASWYATLPKPAFTPPNSVFPVVWNILYLLMAVSAWLVWRARYEVASPAASNRALVPYFVQLVLNTVWSIVFFGWHSPLGGSGVIVLLFGAIAWTMFSFARISRLATWMLLPYLLWVGFATALNAGIYALTEPGLAAPAMATPPAQ